MRRGPPALKCPLLPRVDRTPPTAADRITLEPIRRPFHARVTPPGSKSLTNRALVLAALAHGQSTLRNVLRADDTAVMIDGLRQLGFTLECDDAARVVRVAGGGGAIPAGSADIFCGNSGTTLRFLTALCTLGHGQYLLDGVPRMRQRPVGQLVDLLRNLGGRVACLNGAGTPPVRVHGSPRGLAGGIARFGSAASSQYLSAALQVAPLARREVLIDLDRPQTSWPYVAMTMRLMDEFGAFCELTRDPKTGDPVQINVPPARYAAVDYTVEPDATAASYFLAAAAINPGSRVVIEGLGRASLQGDVRFADVLARMGARVRVTEASVELEGIAPLEAVDADLADMPDVAQTLAVACVFADGPSRLTGLRTLRVKETDRLAALQQELAKLGARADVEGDDAMVVHPPRVAPQAGDPVETYDDHRMAMSFAVASTRINGLTILNPACVNKTYPNFFEDFSRAVTTS